LGERQSDRRWLDGSCLEKSSEGKRELVIEMKQRLREEFKVK